MKPTTRQKQVLDFIRLHIEKEGISPSVREICSHFGLNSPSGIHKILKSLGKKGLLTCEPGKKRSWRPVSFSRNNVRKEMVVLGRIAAGVPIDAQEDAIDVLPIDCSLFGHQDCFALYVKGDSMIEAHIADGDIAVIRPCSDVENGQIAAVQVEGLLTEATLKIVKRTRDGIELHAANPAYEKMAFEKEDAGRVRILGRLVGIIRTRP